MTASASVSTSLSSRLWPAGASGLALPTAGHPRAWCQLIVDGTPVWSDKGSATVVRQLMRDRVQRNLGSRLSAAERPVMLMSVRGTGGLDAQPEGVLPAQSAPPLPAGRHPPIAPTEGGRGATLAAYVDTLVRVGRDYFGQLGQDFGSMGVLIVVGIRPSKRTRLWCDQVDGDIPPDVWQVFDS